MCGNPFKSVKTPTVEPAPPAPTAVQSQDVDTMASDAEQQRKKKGYRASRVAEDRNVLTDSGKKTTLG